ncbi:MAG: magnesium transporter CorA family protein, partial [Spirochaetales bacterium]
HNISSAMDPDEIGRMEFEEDHTMIIIKSPKNYSSSDNFLFKVTSVGVFLYKDQLVIIMNNQETSILEGRQAFKITNLNDALLKILYGTIAHFLGHLKVISLLSDSLEQKINTSMANEHLLNMFTIEKSLIYYLNGINSNSVVMEKLKMNAVRIGLSTENLALLDDIVIENNQCNKQAEIYSNILTGLNDARGSIVNNNMNQLIKRLTVLSVVFMPLNVIAGMGGMSEFSMMTSGIPWPVAYGLATVGMVGVAYLTYWILKKFTDGPGKKIKRR